jgi:hypothetical protein
VSLVRCTTCERRLLDAIEGVLDALPLNTGEGMTQHVGILGVSIVALAELRAARDAYQGVTR